jgi:hypothetical protein
MSMKKSPRKTGSSDTRAELDALLALEPCAIDNNRVFALTGDKIAAQSANQQAARSGSWSDAQPADRRAARSARRSAARSAGRPDARQAARPDAQSAARPDAQSDTRTATAAKPRPRRRGLRVAAAVAAALAVGVFGSIGIASAATGTDPVTFVAELFVPERQIFDDSLTIDASPERPADEGSLSYSIYDLRFSNISSVYQGAELPDGVTPDHIYWGGVPSDYADEQTGTTLGDYKYIFVDFTVTNEWDGVKQYFFNGARLFVLGADNEVLGGGSEVCYYNGIDMAEQERIMLNGQEYDPNVKKEGSANYTPEQIEAKQSGSIKLQAGETRTIRVAFVISESDLAKGELYFTPSTAQGTSPDDPALPWYFTKLDK